MIRPEAPRAGLPVYSGLFFTTLSTLMYEVLLTRIFSVTMWYHFAFVAVSVALFGMTVGALIVHLLPKFFDERRLPDQLAIAALLFSVTHGPQLHRPPPHRVRAGLVARWRRAVRAHLSHHLAALHLQWSRRKPHVDALSPRR